MPATVPLLYDSYRDACAVGTLDLSGVLCPACRQPSLRLLGSTVQRKVVTVEVDAYGVAMAVEHSARIALARCDGCRGRFRVLPPDVAPHKPNALPLIEHLCRAYLKGDQSLRGVA